MCETFVNGWFKRTWFFFVIVYGRRSDRIRLYHVIPIYLRSYALVFKLTFNPMKSRVTFEYPLHSKGRPSKTLGTAWSWAGLSYQRARARDESSQKRYRRPLRSPTSNPQDWAVLSWRWVKSCPRVARAGIDAWPVRDSVVVSLGGFWVSYHFVSWPDFASLDEIHTIGGRGRHLSAPRGVCGISWIYTSTLLRKDLGLSSIDDSKPEPVRLDHPGPCSRERVGEVKIRKQFSKWAHLNISDFGQNFRNL